MMYQNAKFMFHPFWSVQYRLKSEFLEDLKDIKTGQCIDKFMRFKIR